MLGRDRRPMVFTGAADPFMGIRGQGWSRARSALAVAISDVPDFGPEREELALADALWWHSLAAVVGPTTGSSCPAESGSFRRSRLGNGTGFVVNTGGDLSFGTREPRGSCRLQHRVSHHVHCQRTAAGTRHPSIPFRGKARPWLICSSSC